MEYLILIFWLLVFALLGALATFILSKVFKNKLVKYIPSILLLILNIYYIIQATSNSTEGMRDLAYFLSFILFSSSMIGSFATAVIIDKKCKSIN